MRFSLALTFAFLGMVYSQTCSPDDDTVCTDQGLCCLHVTYYANNAPNTIIEEYECDVSFVEDSEDETYYRQNFASGYTVQSVECTSGEGLLCSASDESMCEGQSTDLCCVYTSYSYGGESYEVESCQTSNEAEQETAVALLEGFGFEDVEIYCVNSQSSFSIAMQISGFLLAAVALVGLI